jgi:hypothetical protein
MLILGSMSVPEAAQVPVADHLLVPLPPAVVTHVNPLMQLG